tara:strand:+ start:1141 stop:1350 length:210 start_codon:yes stop_codon:yes gene_type:complete
MTVRHEYYDRGNEEVVCLFEVDSLPDAGNGYTREDLSELIEHLEEIRDDWARRIEEENSFSLFEETDDE